MDSKPPIQDEPDQDEQAFHTHSIAATCNDVKVNLHGVVDVHLYERRMLRTRRRDFQGHFAAGQKESGAAQRADGAAADRRARDLGRTAQGAPPKKQLRLPARSTPSAAQVRFRPFANFANGRAAAPPAGGARACLQNTNAVRATPLPALLKSRLAKFGVLAFFFLREVPH